MLWQEDNKLMRRFDRELLVIEGWGDNGLRVRAIQKGHPEDTNYGLVYGEGHPAQIEIDGNHAWITNGKIKCEVLPTGKIRFYNQDGRVLLEEYDRNRFRKDDEGFSSALEINPRTFTPIRGTDHYKLTVRFEAACERIYGMGQYQQENLNLKGCIVEMAQRNSQVSVPFMLSSAGYGLFWNNPGTGRVIFGNNLTEWEAYSTRQMDYWICAGDTPAQIEEAYADVAGKAPMMPDYGMGFWQCKLRYQTQDELMQVAREYKRRNIPVSVIVIDYFHWPHQGDWCFDPEYWPDPAGMVKELKEMGMELMVSVWPTVEESSVNYYEMLEKGFLTASEAGNRMSHLGRTCFVDMTNPDARDYLWKKLKENYYQYGIKIFWLDEAEPEYGPYDFDNYRYYEGTALQCSNRYPVGYAKGFYEGLRAEGETDIMSLVRCAWAGSQKYGVLTWSGDIHSSFRSMREQLQAGLSMSMAGIPWWTSDIGGFLGGDIRDGHFKELLLRWFAWGAFCPVFRMHGERSPWYEREQEYIDGVRQLTSGQDNEVWSFGEDNYQILSKYLFIREKLRPYIRNCMRKASETGAPVMRPLFYDFPDDKTCWETEDAYMFGEDLLVAPVMEEGVRERQIYLPAGCRWTDAYTKKGYEGGQTVTVPAPIDIIPVMIREGKQYDIYD